MKPLLRPHRPLDPEIVTQNFGLGATTFEWVDLERFDRARAEIIRMVQELVDAPGIFVQQEIQTRGGSFMGTYEFKRKEKEKAGHRHGSACLGYLPLQNQNGCLTLTLFWSSLPPDIERVVAAVDDIWRAGSFDSLYAYDYLDHSIQNKDMPYGMEYYGLDPQQVEYRPVFGMEIIDTRYNPGFKENRDGVLFSVQWLTYWSQRAQKAILKSTMPPLPPGVEMAHLPDGGVRLRLGKSPGRFDDVPFHQLQLATRETLGLLPGNSCPP